MTDGATYLNGGPRNEPKYLETLPCFTKISCYIPGKSQAVALFIELSDQCLSNALLGGRE